MGSAAFLVLPRLPGLLTPNNRASGMCRAGAGWESPSHDDLALCCLPGSALKSFCKLMTFERVGAEGLAHINKG